MPLHDLSHSKLFSLYFINFMLNKNEVVNKLESISYTFLTNKYLEDVCLIKLINLSVMQDSGLIAGITVGNFGQN